MRVNRADRQLLQLGREWQRLVLSAKVQAEFELNVAVLQAAGDACEIGIGKVLGSPHGGRWEGQCL